MNGERQWMQNAMCWQGVVAVAAAAVWCFFNVARASAVSRDRLPSEFDSVFDRAVVAPPCMATAKGEHRALRDRA